MCSKIKKNFLFVSEVLFIFQLFLFKVNSKHKFLSQNFDFMAMAAIGL